MNSLIRTNYYHLCEILLILMLLNQTKLGLYNIITLRCSDITMESNSVLISNSKGGIVEINDYRIMKIADFLIRNKVDCPKASLFLS